VGNAFWHTVESFGVITFRALFYKSPSKIPVYIDPYKGIALGNRMRETQFDSHLETRGNALPFTSVQMPVKALKATLCGELVGPTIL
jgi:hypothetical protein